MPVASTPNAQLSVVVKAIQDLPLWAYVLDRRKADGEDLKVSLLFAGFTLLEKDTYPANPGDCVIDCRKAIPAFVPAVLRRYGDYNRIVCLLSPKTHEKWDQAVPEFRHAATIAGHNGTRVNYFVL
jgi:hypothetical protein